MKGLEFIFLGMGSVLGAFLRYKLTESPLIFNTLPVNVLIVNIAGAFILGVFVVVSQQWHLDSKYSTTAHCQRRTKSTQHGPGERACD